jgi:hypothetical protein
LGLAISFGRWRIGHFYSSIYTLLEGVIEVQQQYCAFDLEVAALVPEGEDLSDHHPLGITCAASYSRIEINGSPQYCSRVWHPTLNHGTGRYDPTMTVAQVTEMLYNLAAMQYAGVPVITWNGLGFDFREIDSLVVGFGAHCLTRALAIDHTDIAFHMFCEKGFMAGLSKVTQAMAVGQKTEGMAGALAPQKWAGSRHDQDLVLEYVANDAKITGLLLEAVVEAGLLRWVSRTGRMNTWPVPALLPVREASMLPEPDTSWMDHPWSRDKFTGWLQPIPPSLPTATPERPPVIASVKSDGTTDSTAQPKGSRLLAMRAESSRGG